MRSGVGGELTPILGSGASRFLGVIRRTVGDVFIACTGRVIVNLVPVPTLLVTPTVP